MKSIHNYTLLPVALNLFDGEGGTIPSVTTAAAVDLNTNVTTAEALKPENKVFYEQTLIEMAEPELIHDQFGQKKPIPQGRGKTIEFRKYEPFAAIPKDRELVEGVTPDGQSLSVTAMESTVKQYGGYVTLSDILELTAIDNNVIEATKGMGSQAGRVLDKITREVINAGSNVQYADGSVVSRAALDETNLLTVDAIRRAVRTLKRQNAQKINGYYVGIIHTDVAYDLKQDKLWENVKTYDPGDLYQGEIGRIEGVRFVETPTAKVFVGAGKDGRDVYSTLILGANAYGVTELSGGGLQHIVKQRGSGGTQDPLDQRSTVGWKATKTAEILVDAYMVRIETGSNFTGDNADN